MLWSSNKLTLELQRLSKTVWIVLDCHLDSVGTVPLEVLQQIGVDCIDESEVLTVADEARL